MGRLLGLIYGNHTAAEVSRAAMVALGAPIPPTLTL